MTSREVREKNSTDGYQFPADPAAFAKQCRSMQGDEVDLRVPAGKIHTCKVNYFGIVTVWMGTVPFDVVKIRAFNLPNPIPVVSTLESFAFGPEYLTSDDE